VPAYYIPLSTVACDAMHPSIVCVPRWYIAICGALIAGIIGLKYWALRRRLSVLFPSCLLPRWIGGGRGREHGFGMGPFFRHHPSISNGRPSGVDCALSSATGMALCLLCCADKKRAGIRDGLCVVVGRRGIVLSASVAGE
jgi:hypothetical protein